MGFATYSLELRSPLHIGAGRSGTLARCHGFVPGHVLSYALTATLGAAWGGRPEDFDAALQTVLDNLRCGPLFLDDQGQALRPRRDRARIEAGFLIASNHVALHTHTRSAVEGALFEVESIAPQRLHEPGRATPARLRGGLWCREDTLAGHPLPHWLGRLRLGGELKVGLGRVCLKDWSPGAECYPGLGRADDQGLHLEANDILPGPALDGVTEAPLSLWTGRLFDPRRGFGGRFSPPALVRLDGVSPQAACFLPHVGEIGLGCWSPVQG